MRFVMWICVLLILASSVCFAATQLRQLAMVYLPGDPGFQDVTLLGNYLLISHSGNASLDVFDVAKRRLITQIKIERPRGIAIDDPGHKVYVANAGTNSIAVVSTQTWKLESTIPLKLQPGPLAVSGDGEKLYVGHDQNQSISVLDTDHPAQLATEAVDGHPAALLYDPTRNLLYASLEDQARIAVLDPNLKVLRRYPLSASQPTAMVLDPRTSRLYVAVRYAVLALNPDDGRELSRVPAAAGVDGLWLDPAGKLYAAAGNEIEVISATANSFVAEGQMPLKIRGHGVAFDSTRKLLLMPGGREGRSLVLILKPLVNLPGSQPPAQVLSRDK
jgi:YVTN family beta-propeller protein